MVPPPTTRWSRLRPIGRKAPADGAPRNRQPDDDGISLIEVLVAFVVLMITVIPLTYVLNSALVGAANARQREAALQLADSWLEILSNSTPPTRADGSIMTNTPQPPVVPTGAIAPNPNLAVGTRFTVEANYSFQSVNQTGRQSDLCTDGAPPSPTHPGVIQIQVTVYWGGKNGRDQSLTDTTNINYPKPGLQTEGFLAVQVNNEGATDVWNNLATDRLAAVKILVTGGGLAAPGLTLKPDTNGCAFAQVPVSPPGNPYSVQIAQPDTGTLGNYPGTPLFVDPNGNTSPPAMSETVFVTQETTAIVTFDEGINTSISYGGAAAVDAGVACPGKAGLTCLALGNGPSSASAAWGGNGSTWSATSLAGVTNLAQVGCTSGGSPTCVGVGDSVSGGTSTGVIMTTSSDLGTTRSDTVPAGVTDLTQVACPTDNGCYALGTTSAGDVLLAGVVGQTAPQQDTWVEIAPPTTTFSSLSSIACLRTTTTCVVGEAASVGGGASVPGFLRLDGDPGSLASNGAWVPTFNLEQTPPNLQSVGTVTCPSASECLATAIGDSTSPSDPTILSASIADTGPDTWVNESTFPTGAGSLTGLSCKGSYCVAIGATAGSTPTPEAWTGDLTDSPDDWAQVANGAGGIPTSVSALTSVACGSPSGSDTADCVMTATAAGQPVPGELLEGSLNGAWTWNATTAQTGSPVLYYTGVACQTTNGGSTCAAAGATSSGPVIVTSSGPSDRSWNARTPSSLAGATVTGIPLETSPATLTSWTTQVTQAQARSANATSLPNALYPLASGYSIVAGDCSAEAGSNSQGSLQAAPGGVAAATVPLGLLPLQVVTPVGGDVGGATVVLTSTQCSSPFDTYTLPVTDVEGLTTAAVPYGTYSYSVNGAPVAGATITVGLNSVTYSGSPGPNFLPGPVQVVS